jgi:hypothetical protein
VAACRDKSRSPSVIRALDRRAIDRRIFPVDVNSTAAEYLTQTIQLCMASPCCDLTVLSSSRSRRVTADRGTRKAVPGMGVTVTVKGPWLLFLRGSAGFAVIWLRGRYGV